MIPPADAAELGATLYVPAIRNDLALILSGERHPGLRSVVICLEDSVAEPQVEAAFTNLRSLLRAMPGSTERRAGPRFFVRPRHALMLERVAVLPEAAAIDGFVIPKATAESLPAYLAPLSNTRHLLMPTIETREAFDPAAMAQLRAAVLAIRDRVLLVRIGGNDLLHLIGARRSRARTAYDGPLGPVVAALVGAFAPWGVPLSAPVLECFRDTDLLREEVARDLEHGLFTKTAIHPDQIAVIEDAYRVHSEDLEQAHAVLSGSAGAVFARNGAMCETAVHSAWARATLRRSEVFGVAPSVLSSRIKA